MLGVGFFAQFPAVSVTAAVSYTVVKLIGSTVSGIRDARQFKAHTLQPLEPSPYDSAIERLEVAITIAFLIHLVIPGATMGAGAIGWFGIVANVLVVGVVAMFVGGANIEFTRRRGWDFKRPRARR